MTSLLPIGSFQVDLSVRLCRVRRRLRLIIDNYPSRCFSAIPVTLIKVKQQINANIVITIYNHNFRSVTSGSSFVQAH